MKTEVTTYCFPKMYYLYPIEFFRFNFYIQLTIIKPVISSNDEEKIKKHKR